MDAIDRAPTRHRSWLLPALLLAAVLALHLWSLMRFPAPFVDEAWNSSCILTVRFFY